MSEYIKPQTGLTTYSVLPENFALEAHHLENGCVETNKMGANRQTNLTGYALSKFIEQLGFDLIKCLCRKFKLTPDQCIMLNEYSNEAGEMLVWARSTVPVGREHIECSDAPLELVAGEIEVVATPVNTPLPLPSSRPRPDQDPFARLARRLGLPVPRPDSSVVDLP